MRVLCLLLLSSAAAAQEPVDGRIAFTVTDGTGAPVGGALIVLNGSTTGEKPKQIMRHGATDAAGVVRFAGLPNGYYRVESHTAGHSLDPSRQPQVQLEGLKANVASEVRLFRRPVLTGRVVNSRGIPVLRAIVSLERRTTDAGRPGITQATRAMTDDRGVFRIAVQEPGRFWVKASATEASFPRGSAPAPTGVVFYPGSPDLLGAQPVDLGWDQPEMRVDITLPPAPRTQLAVAIVSGPGQAPCGRCRYSLRRVEGPYSYEIIGGQTGNRPGFDYRGIPAGGYRIYVEDYQRNRGWWAIAESALVEGRPTELVVATQPPILLSGRIVLEDPPAELMEQNRDREDAVSVTAETVGRMFFGGPPSVVNPRSLPLDDLNFELGPLAPERFRLRVVLKGANGYVAGVSRQGRALPAGILDLAGPGPWTDLEIRVRFDPASVRIRLPPSSSTDAENYSARIVLVPLPAAESVGPLPEGHCFPGGECSTAPVPPGRYWAIALPGVNDPQSLDLRDLETQRRLGAWGRELELSPGENPVMELEVVPVDAVDGRR